MSTVRAVILAAGRGTRMGGRTTAIPKCLIPLVGKPLLEWQLAALRAAGISEIAIVTGYRGELLEPFGCTLFRNERWESTNMVRSLECAESWLQQEACVVSYSDIVYHPANVLPLIKCDSDLAITYDRKWRELWSERFRDPLLDAESFEVDKTGRVVEIGRRLATLDQAQGQFMGLLRFTPTGYDTFRSVVNQSTQPNADKMDMTTALRTAIDSGAQVRGHAVSGRWCELDCEEDLTVYERLIQEAEPWTHDWRW